MQKLETFTLQSHTKSTLLMNLGHIVTDLEHINKLKSLKPGDTMPEEEKTMGVAMSMSEVERGMSMKQRKQQKMQRLRDKVRIRLDMIEHEFKELQ